MTFSKRFGQLCGTNPVPVLIPCHRIFRCGRQVWRFFVRVLE
ncbi:MAG: MGMT family protein [Oscillospiraceae bacterium]|nr:MGMT family protein [Oscillospiraceae bacterium]